MSSETIDPPLEAPAAERVLVIRLGALGDVVRTRFVLPALRGLYPRARIDWLVDDRAAGGLAGVVGLDGVHVVPRSEVDWRRPLRGLRRVRGLIERLREVRYDLALDFHSNLRSAWLARSAEIPIRVGYGRGTAREGAQYLLTHRVRLAERHVSRFERNAALLHALGAADGTTLVPPLDLPRDDEIGAEIPDELQSQGFVVIHPGTSRGTEYKRWPAARFGRVAARLRDEAGLGSLVTFGPDERALAETVVATSAGAARLAPETRSIGRMLSLLRRARLFVGGDSGPAHLAALAGCAQVVVFGPTDPVENAPFPGVASRVVRRDVGCNPCREGCPIRTCLVAIEPEPVAEAALALARGAALRAGSGPAGGGLDSPGSVRSL